MSDLKPFPWETLGDYIDRIICGRAPRRNQAEVPPSMRFFEPSWVSTPAVNAYIQGV